MIIVTPQVLDDMDYYLPDEASLQGLASFFSLLADASRVKILSALTISPLCVTDLASIVKMNQTTVSHQLRLLKDRGVVRCTRVGKLIKYAISNKKINEILLVGVEYLGMGQSNSVL